MLKVFLIDKIIVNIKYLNIWEEIGSIRSIWTNPNMLQNSSYFLSWGWIENWITSLPKDVSLQLAVILEGDDQLATFFVGKSQVDKKRIFKSRGLFLNTTGITEYDDTLWIEYNSIFLKNSVNLSIDDIVSTVADDWDELFLPALDGNVFPGDSLKQYEGNHYKVLIEKEIPSYYVDLSLVRKKDGDYTSILSANTRMQIKQSYRGYNSKGKIAVEIARSIERAIEIWDEMKQLHYDTWEKRGNKSNFITKYSEEFHKNLIRKRYAQGEIQLLRVTCGEKVIGCLYNFVYKGHVFFYQSGLNYETDKHLRPGFICHAEAIKINAMLNHSTYDFLGGLERYKASLATNKRELIWARVQKNHLKFQIENKLKDLCKPWLKRLSKISSNNYLPR